MAPLRRSAGRLARGFLALSLIGAPSGALAWRMEADTITVQDTFVNPTWTSVTFRQSYPAPPLVFVTATNNGGDPSALRVRNVTSIGFEVLQVEPSAEDGPHLAMTLAYVAIEPGNHVLPDGEPIVALTRGTTTTQGGGAPGGWDSVAFGTTFAATPAVLGQIQTTVNETGNPPSTSSIPWLTVALRNVGLSSVQAALERAESSAGSVNFNETIGIAALRGNAVGSFVDNAGNTIDYEGLRTPDNIRGWGDGCFTNSFAGSYAGAPLVTASQNTRDGNNGGWLRRCSLSAGQIGLTVDEDEDGDSERNHTTEVAGVWAFSASFDANFAPSVIVGKVATTVSDPFNGGADPKAIPGAEADYIISVENDGLGATDTGSVEIVDPVPAATALVVSDIAGGGSGPVEFTEPGAPSGLTYNFAGLGSAADDLEFSSDGGITFSYTPTAGADGTDPNVTHIRLTPGGRLNGRSGAVSPAANFRFKVRVQ